MAGDNWRTSGTFRALFLKRKWLGADEVTGGTRRKCAAPDKLEEGMSSSPKAAAQGAVRRRASGLLAGEHADIRIDVRTIVKNADDWLVTPNTAFGGRTPNELIGTPDEYFIRETLRSAIYSGMA